MTKTLIAGNWKMNLNTHDASLYLHKLEKLLPATHQNTEVVVIPNMLVLQSLSLQAKRHQIRLGAQNAYWRDEGAYTGEVSATMLRGIVDYILVGHSERRHIFGETNSEVRNKVQAVLRNGMTPLLCVGETAGERADGETKHVLHDQVVAGLANVTSDEVEGLVIAYEPVWAIGSGVFARPDDVKEAVTVIRAQISALYGDEAAKKVRVLYGGSVDSGNAGEFLKTPGVNGLLIGGASLKGEEFAKIVEQAGRQ